MSERLQKIISAAGKASRRAAEKMISDGRVTVNGNVAKLGDSADTELDDIRIDGESIAVREEKTYIMLNKPTGYVTTLSDEKGRPTVAGLVAGVGKRVYPIGRLDLNSQGLLLMTDDGELANKLMHPRHNVDKVYVTRVSGGDIDKAVEILGGELVIDGYKIRPAGVEILERGDNRAALSITIHEGRNRQVRKMCALAGLTVHSLCRVSEGGINLGGLPLGKWRYLDENEVKYLKKLD